MTDNGMQSSAVEALILASPEPLPARKVVDVVEDMTPSKVGKSVAELNNRYMEAGCSFRIRELAGGYQFYVVPEFAFYVQELFSRKRKMRMTRASLETLAIAAYRQPVTKTDIEHIRGVASDGVLRNLLEKNLVVIKGRAQTVGKPLQYGTGDEFLKFFGLASLDDLPKMSEIEELISSREPQPQTELLLDHAEDGEAKPEKLNVADGTFDPASVETDDEPVYESLVAAAVVTDEEAAVSVEPDDVVEEEDAVETEDEVVPGETQQPAGVIVDMDTTEEPPQ